VNITNVIASPWAIQPEKYQEILSIYGAHVRGEKIDLQAVEAQLGRPLDNQTVGYEVTNGVAVLPLQGVLAKRMNLFTKISGGASTELAMKDFKAALEDPSVSSIILAIDSPGGAVDGIKEFADLIYVSRGQKPVISLGEGLMASAGYYLGAAAEKVYISDGLAQVGSIGVVAAHRDISGMEAKAGIKTTEVFAGRYKRIASQYQPLSDEGRADIQEKLDYVYSVFVEDVARYRGVSTEKVLTDMADGRIFIGEQAVTAGLVDGVSTLDGLMGKLAARRAVGVETANTLEVKSMPVDVDFDDVVAAFMAQGISRGQAVARAARENPEAHEKYVAGLPRGPRRQEPQRQTFGSLGTEFERLCKERAKEKGQPIGLVIPHVAREHPETHKKYLAAVAEGGAHE
jgi:signal peptide peptidase SppA